MARKLCCLLMVLSLVCLGAFQATAGEVIKWRAQSTFAPGDFSADLLPSFAEEVKEKSGGRLIISTHYEGELVPQDNVLKATGRGIIQMGQSCGVFWSGVEPILGLEFGLPFGFQGTLEEVENLVEKTGLYDQWEAAYARQKCHLLGIHTYGPYPAIASNVPIRSYDDFKNLKIRALLEVADLLKAIGASPGYVPGGEIYMALKLGTFDAATYSVDAIRGFKWHEVIDYYILPYWCDWYFGDVFINQKAWNELPDDLKAILYEAMENYGQKNKEIYSKEVRLIEEKADELGYEVITLPEEDVAKIKQTAIHEIWSAYANKGPECAKAIESLKKYHGLD